MKGLDLRKFEKCEQSDKCTTLMHPDGHKITIAHTALKGDLKKQLDALPLKMKSGGMVESSGAEPTQKPERSMEELGFTSPEDAIKNVDSEYQAAQADADAWQQEGDRHGQTVAASELAQGQQGLISQQNLNAEQPMSTLAEPQIGQGMQMQMGGIQKEANALSQQATAEQKIAKEQQNQAVTMQKNYDTKLGEIQSEIANVTKDYKDGHIDPNHFWNNKSTLGKASTVIGLILGGFGEGTVGHNAALEYLNKQIDRDIDAQKANMGKQGNLLNSLNQQFGNMNDATKMAKLMYADIYTAQLNEAAAKSKSPIAQARAQQAMGQIRAALDKDLHSITKSQTIRAAVTNGQLSPEIAIQHVVPKERQAEAYKEMESLQNANEVVANLSKTMKQVEQLQTLKERAGSPLQSKSKINALNVEIMSTLKPIFGALSESDKAAVEGSMIGLTDNADTAAKKTQTLIQIATRGMRSTPVLDAYGLKPKQKLQSKPNAR